MSAARNLALTRARAEWVSFLDADDWLLPAGLETLCAVLDADLGPDVVVAGWRRVSSEGEELAVDLPHVQGAMFEELARRPVFPIHACIARRSLIQALGFDPELPVCTDWDLWQRVARAGAQFRLISDVVADYTIRADSLTADLQRFLRCALSVIERGHRPDPRVESPAPDWADGAAPSGLPVAKLRLLAWLGGFAIGRGLDPVPLLAIEPEPRSAVDPPVVADSLAHAVPLGAGRAATAWAELWPRFDQSIDRFLVALEQRTGPRGAGGMTRRELERLALERAGGPGTRTVGRMQAVRLELAEQLEDVPAASDAERLVLDLTVQGDALGRLELPVCQRPVPARVIADAVAARLFWPLLGRYFDRRLYPDPEADVGMWLAERALGDELGSEELATTKVLHDRIGWAVFLQELWGLPGVPERDLYEPPRPGHTRRGRLARALGILRALRDGSDPWLPVEVSRELPMPPPGAEAVRVVPSLGGVPLGVVSLRLSPGDGRAQLRAAVTTACGLELARVAVREAIIGRPVDDPGTLRERLAEIAGARSETTPRPPSGTLPGGIYHAPGWGAALAEAWERGSSALVLARRDPGVIGTSASRRAVLPAAAQAELADAAAAAREPVVRLAGPDPERVLYLPELSWTRRDGGASHAAGSPARPAAATSRSTRTGAYDRHRFETVFAEREDPWGYTRSYERAKYEQTLALLGDGLPASALEVGSAEGRFTVLLAPRVGDLLCADISEIALARAKRRCAECANVRFVQLDIVTDPVPGRFDLIVCSEVLYYVGGREELDQVARKLGEAVAPGGRLVTAHSHQLIDDPDEPGYDWGLPFGAKVIGESLEGVASLRLVRELRAPLYRVQCFQRAEHGERSAPADVVAVPHPSGPSVEAAVGARPRGPATTEPGPAEALTKRLPILVYHRIASGDAPARRRISPEGFAEQLRYLRAAGFRSVTLDDWRRAVETRTALPGHGVIVTFDDAYRDFAQVAWPLLKEHGFGALLFVVTGAVGDTNRWSARSDEKVPLLGWEEIAAVHSEGVEIGSHSISHPFLPAQSPAEVVREVAGSRATLTRRLGAPPKALAYPYGASDEAVEHLAGACGYTYGLTCRGERGRFDDPLLSLPRIEIEGGDDLGRFIAKLGSDEPSLAGKS